MAAIEHTRTSLDKIEVALTVLALEGDNAARAARVLAADINTKVSERTLRKWRDAHQERYAEIRTTRAREVEASLVHTTRDLAVRYSELEAQAAEATAAQLAAGTIKDPSTVARNAAVAKGISIDKLMLLTARPTQITKPLNGDEILRSLAAFGKVFDTTGERIADTDTDDQVQDAQVIDLRTGADQHQRPELPPAA